MSTTTVPFRFGPAVLVLSIAVAAAGGAPAAATAADPTADPSPGPLTLLWSAAQPGVTIKTEPYWPAINPATGDIWVSSPFTDQFWIFGADGTFKEAWGTPGDSDGQFHLRTNNANPDAGAAIAFMPDGSFVLTDVGNYRVQHFTADRQFVGAWGSFGTDPGQFVNPKGIATDGATVYVSDDGGPMQVFDSSGTFLRAFDFPFVLFTLTPAGTLLTTDPTGIAEFDPNGNLIRHIALTVSGSMLTQPIEDSAGTIWVGAQTDSQPTALIELAPDGTVIGQWTSGYETAALSPDGSAIYTAWTAPSNHGWPEIRTYGLPLPTSTASPQ
jgi:hypothetical protein